MMGGTDKSTKLKGQAGKSKESVSEATISKLMNDFNCASLLSSSRPPSSIDQTSPEDLQYKYERVVSSLKHLHLKKPIKRKNRIKEKKILERKTKAASGDECNLSITSVNSQRSLIWPVKFVNVPQQTDPNVILQPSKLSKPYKDKETDLSSSSSSFSTSIHTSSSEEKARIAASLCNTHQSAFNISQEHAENSHLSFSNICKKKRIPIKEDNVIPCCPHDNCKNSSVLSNSSSVKSQCSYNSSPKHVEHLMCEERDVEKCCNVSSFFNHPSIRDGGKPDSSTSRQANFLWDTNLSYVQNGNSSSSSSLSADENVEEDSNSPAQLDISRGLSSRSPPANSAYSVERSCSEEMRMEEANVNELASYFEDLLHIPRKMSVMAEMMYA